ncbi:unnamed protein product [Rotaria sordida]|uniref:Reverse transcriptase/retrotransposon-derived protein RNase H-like domain-containing protein n=1 Tax=Rotaria sordida TaxID=392033 RepID=A0A815T9K5_9BILA|nr:unnamed protein product [Rotaria sordida]CAF1656085.1 unnamed protein product [Rotaria sordida]
MVVDYKKLNNITIKDNHPLPNMKQATQLLGGGYKFFPNLIRRGASQSQAFLQLKQLLITSSLFLDFPNDNYPVILTTDASEIGIGGTLQQNINGEIKNLYYHSQVTSSTQRRYDSIELEALVI